MFALLTQYLFKTKALSVPGTGTFTIVPKSAAAIFGTRSITAPGWEVLFSQPGTEAEEENREPLYFWLASQLGGSRQEAQQAFEQFSSGLHSQLEAGQKITWEGLGDLQKTDGNIDFSPADSMLSPFTGVSAQKVIREGASHAVLVGDHETTTGQMREDINARKEPKISNNKLAWLLLLLSVAAMGWYFVTKGCNISATGNQQKAKVEMPGSTYELR